MQKILVIDNYDSFVYNLVQLLRESGLCHYDVVKNNEIPLDCLHQWDKILLSPGPGVPQTSGQLLQVIQQAQHTHSILGICLGHQALAVHFGAQLIQMEHPKHGHLSQLSNVQHSSPLFANMSHPVRVGRYHSWVVNPDSLDSKSGLIATAFDEDNNIMALQHTELPLYGVQFHPESIISNCGEQIIKNWLQLK
ncbi:MAG: anthranilate synthase component II [Marinifilaceae bacterium]